MIKISDDGNVLSQVTLLHTTPTKLRALDSSIMEEIVAQARQDVVNSQELRAIIAELVRVKVEEFLGITIKTPQTNAERQRQWRERKKAGSVQPVETVKVAAKTTPLPAATAPVTTLSSRLATVAAESGPATPPAAEPSEPAQEAPGAPPDVSNTLMTPAEALAALAEQEELDAAKALLAPADAANTAPQPTPISVAPESPESAPAPQPQRHVRAADDVVPGENTAFKQFWAGYRMNGGLERAAAAEGE